MEISTKSTDLGASPEMTGRQGSSTRGMTEVSPNLSGPLSDIPGGRLNKSLPKRTIVNLASSDITYLYSWFAAVANHSKMHKSHSRDKFDPEYAIDVDEDIGAGQSFLVDGNEIEDTLTDMHSFLCTSQFKKDREYGKCPLSTVEE